jgi:iron uptake system component EfeO
VVTIRAGRTRIGRALVAATAFVALASAVASCGGDDAGSSGSASTGGAAVRTVEVKLTDGGCEPKALQVPAGPTTFHVTNGGSAGATEFEVLDGGKILGEVENVAPGIDRSFSITLKAGHYATKCTADDKQNGTLDVNAAAPTSTAAGNAASASKDSQQAVESYVRYVDDQATQLVAAVEPFVAAVKSGDQDQAKALFARGRYHYETVEPIAESFGDLDPAIDAREGDVPDAEWTGFHRIEKALWVDGNTSDMGPVADRLLTDVKDLKARVPSLSLEPAQIANGAVELLNEVSASKITGEEDRYSHTDLSDFAANVEGSKAAFQAVRPLLGSDDRQLATDIDQRFADVEASLGAHRDPASIANGYQLYTALSPDQTRKLSAAVDALAEPLSQVAAKVLQ